jgi:hypothetical protein
MEFTLIVTCSGIALLIICAKLLKLGGTEMEGDKIHEDKSRKRFWVVIAVAVLIIASSVWLGIKTSENEPAATDSQITSPEIKAEHTITQSELNIHQMEGQTVDSRLDEDYTARIRIGSEEIQLAFNARGELPRLTVPPEANIAATVKFPNAIPGQRISVQAEDGGLFIGDAASGIVLIDDQQQAYFEFQPSANEGQYRVTLRNGGESRVLEFWIGPELPVLVRK